MTAKSMDDQELYRCLQQRFEHAGEHGFSRGSWSNYTPGKAINDEDGRNADPAMTTVRWKVGRHVHTTQ